VAAYPCRRNSSAAAVTRRWRVGTEEPLDTPPL
jgi:hypothetical protein